MAGMTQAGHRSQSYAASRMISVMDHDISPCWLSTTFIKLWRWAAIVLLLLNLVSSTQLFSGTLFPLFFWWLPH